MNTPLRIAAAVAVLLLTTTVGVEAKHKDTSKQKNIHRVIRDVTPSYAGTTQLSAKRSYKRTRYASGGRGACDGFHRCRCGTTAARNFGISYAHNGWNLKQAKEWRHFPRTAFHIGAAGVQEHHVLKVVGGSSCSNATVTDEAGTYQRNVCNMTFHSVNGGSTFASNETPTRRVTRSHSGGVRYASNSSGNYGANYYHPSSY